jgi:hypothetical protein
MTTSARPRRDNDPDPDEHEPPAADERPDGVVGEFGDEGQSDKGGDSDPSTG